jgi:hypothetical protein
MGRKSKKNRAYRTKEELVKDVTTVLNAPLTYGTKFFVCKQAASEWTEHSGKYKDCPLWSKKAFEAYQANSKVKDLRHEHAVPKKVVIDVLLNLQNPSEDDVSLWFKFLIGVVVTLEEDRVLNSRFKSSMPSDFLDEGSSCLDPLLRYKKCGIEVVGLEWPRTGNASADGDRYNREYWAERSAATLETADMFLGVANQVIPASALSYIEKYVGISFAGSRYIWLSKKRSGKSWLSFRVSPDLQDETSELLDKNNIPYKRGKRQKEFSLIVDKDVIEMNPVAFATIVRLVKASRGIAG